MSLLYHNKTQQIGLISLAVAFPLPEIHSADVTLLIFLVTPSGRVEEVKGGQNSALEDSCDKVSQAMEQLVNFLQRRPELVQAAARDVATSIAHIYIGEFLLGEALCLI